MFHGYPVKIELWRPRVLHNALVFTRLTMFYVKSRPPGSPPRDTLTNAYETLYRPGGFGWDGPPSADSTCLRSYGLNAAAACNNTN